MVHHRSPPPRRAADVAQRIWCINFTLAPSLAPSLSLSFSKFVAFLLFKQNYVTSVLNHWRVRSGFTDGGGGNLVTIYLVLHHTEALSLSLCYIPRIRRD